jgi:hypothetical protein
MSKLTSTILLFFVLFFNCVQFPSSYEQIKSNDTRLVDIVYDPPEAAPGDTIKVKAIFAGKKLDINHIDWKISYNLVSNIGGLDTIFNLQPISSTVKLDSFSKNTSCFSFNIVVPSTIMHENIPENWLSPLPEDLRKNIPSEINSLSKTQILDYIELLAQQARNSPLNIQAALQTNPVLQTVFPALLQVLTTRIQLQGEVKGEYTLVSNYSVRYTSLFDGLVENVYKNNNPLIDSVVIIKIPGGSNPTAQISHLRMDRPDGIIPDIVIENGYSYELCAYLHDIDTTVTLIDALNNTRHMEDLTAVWFYELNDNEIKDVPVANQMNISGNTLSATLFPPSDHQITTFNIWVKVKDFKNGELHRPQGSSVKEIEGRFIYR